MSPKPKFSMEIFLAQIDKIMDEFKIAEDRLFDARLGLKNKLYRWRRGDVKGLTIHTLLLISETFAKSLDWLVGREDKVLPTISETPSRYKTGPPAPTDIDLIARVTAAVISYLHAARLQISPSRLGVLVSMVYEHCVVEQVHPDESIIKPYYLLSRRVP